MLLEVFLFLVGFVDYEKEQTENGQRYYFKTKDKNTGLTAYPSSGCIFRG